MPELDIITVPQCAQLSHAEFLIPSSDGHHTYFVSLTTTNRGDYIAECGCPGAKYHGKCKHIKEAEAKRCLWHSQFDEEQKEDGICPRCGGPTENIRFGV
jgi:hypothetical protein